MKCRFALYVAVLFAAMALSGCGGSSDRREYGDFYRSLWCFDESTWWV